MKTISILVPHTTVTTHDWKLQGFFFFKNWQKFVVRRLLAAGGLCGHGCSGKKRDGGVRHRRAVVVAQKDF